MFEFNGKWLCDERFLNLEPMNMFHKNLDREREKELKKAHPDELKNVHILIKKEFDISTDAWDEIKLIFSADDYAKIKINGQLAAIGPCQGYYFNYYRNEVDIKKYLKNGKNLIEAEVFYSGLISRAHNSGDLRMGFIADIFGTKNGKNELIVCTDESWTYTVLKTYTSKVNLTNNTQFIEDYDSRLEPTDGDFKPCVSKKTDHIFSDEPAVMLQFYEIKPESKEKLPNGGYFYDVGHEVTGHLKIKATGKSGSKIRILCAEELDDSDVKIKFQTRCNCNYDDTWTLADGENELEQFEYKGFRYFTLLPDDGVEITDISVTVRHFPIDDNACTIESNDEILNAVFDICKNGAKYGSQDVYVDCPQREKGQYAGDSTVTSASNVWLTGDNRLLKKAMTDQMLSAIACPGLLCIAPGSEMQEIADYSYQFPILALRHYTMTKDLEFLKKNYETCLGLKEYTRKYLREDGLIIDLNDKWNLVDWPRNLRDDYDFPEVGVDETKDTYLKIPHNVVNAFYVGFLYGVEEIEIILGIEPDGEAERTAEAFNKTFFNEETGLYVDSEVSKHSALHSNIIPLFYGFVPKANRGKIADFIMEKKLCCGVYMSYFLLKALVQAERYDDVYALITSQDENSWYNMVREGGTTCFEAWGKDKKWNTSLCHPWASAPVSVLLEDLLGLSIDGSRGESHLPDGIKIKVKTPMHGEIEF